jgi:hypothetical protein
LIFGCGTLAVFKGADFLIRHLPFSQPGSKLVFYTSVAYRARNKTRTLHEKAEGAAL